MSLYAFSRVGYRWAAVQNCSPFKCFDWRTCFAEIEINRVLWWESGSLQTPAGSPVWSTLPTSMFWSVGGDEPWMGRKNMKNCTARLEKPPQSFILHQKLVSPLWQPNTTFLLYMHVSRNLNIFTFWSLFQQQKKAEVKQRSVSLLTPGGAVKSAKVIFLHK